VSKASAAVALRLVLAASAIEDSPSSARKLAYFIDAPFKRD